MKYTVPLWLKEDCLHGWKWKVGTFCECCNHSINLTVSHPSARKESTNQIGGRLSGSSESPILPRHKGKTGKSPDGP
jgi:hypothetical protein